MCMVIIAMLVGSMILSGCGKSEENQNTSGETAKTEEDGEIVLTFPCIWAVSYTHLGHYPGQRPAFAHRRAVLSGAPAVPAGGDYGCTGKIPAGAQTDAPGLPICG